MNRKESTETGSERETNMFELQQLRAELAEAKAMLNGTRSSLQFQEQQQPEQSKATVSSVIQTAQFTQAGATKENTTFHSPQRSNERAESQRFPVDVLALAKETITDYDGKTCARAWITVVKNIARTFNIDDNHLRILLITKLKGNAQVWLHAHPARLIEPIDNLLDQLSLTFGEQSSKAEIRRKFESRKWKTEENFCSYYDEKMALSNGINIDDDELLDQVIEGIPLQNFRTQARIQCFSTPSEMLRAFLNIRLPARREPPVQPTDYKDAIRCANCNSRGHKADICKKPKREPGSCYACGQLGHLVAQRPTRKSVSTNNYNAS
ncbi:uncharacterized protein LOC117149959 [Drosophila mauritiana]|uniref:Uncharacterized protein LOC117149959 n=1 Tax=Drosophila mauritiana TaxID=7226 RepID=A0A6P8KUE3_DROMA|nr:uncharacterized protein LOC117149959 [Drosophila mauritiana]